MTHGSLFSGIGGFDLAAQWMGWENVFHCEINPFGKKVLNYYWPEAISYNDITNTDFSIHRGRIDVVSGGFPCQPYSLAGKRKGNKDDRHLWPAMLTAIKTISPSWVVGENVPGIVNWSGGLVFEQVQADLETEGYEVFPIVLPACGKEAPHERSRVWFIAYRTNARTKGLQERENQFHGFESSSNSDQFGHGRLQQKFGAECQDKVWSGRAGKTRTVADSISERLEGPNGSQKTIRFKQRTKEGPTDFEKFPTQSPFCIRNDGVPSKLDGIAFFEWRRESIKGAGNAVVPPMAYSIFKVIQECEDKLKQ